MLSMMGFGWLAMSFAALLLIGIVALVVWAAMHLFQSGRIGMSPGPETVREILDQRFARGEIDDEEYDRRRQALDPWR